MYVCMHACMHACVRACVRACVCVWMDGWMDRWMDPWMDACVRACVCVCVCVYICMYASIYLRFSYFVKLVEAVDIFAFKLGKAYLEVNNNAKHKDSGDQVHEVRQVLTVESFTQSSHFVCSGGQQVEQSNDGSLKLGTYQSTVQETW